MPLRAKVKPRHSLQNAEASANRGEKIPRNFRLSALARPVSNRHFYDPESRLDRANLHYHVPAETAFVHVNIIECLPADEPQRSEISKAKSPAVFDQLANEAIPETLNTRHGLTTCLRSESISQDQIGAVLSGCDHKIEVVEIIAAVRIAEQNPGYTGRNV